MRGWTLERTGEPDQVLHFMDHLPDLEPGTGQLAIDIEAVGLVFPDVLQVKGAHQIALPLPCSPCSEVVGRVSRAGPGTTIPEASRVMGLAAVPPGALRADTLVWERDVVPIEEHVAASAAAALPCNYVTAYLALRTRARMEPGETVVVHGAAGGVGSAAVQLAKAGGGRVVAVDQGERRMKFCEQLGADAVVDATNGPHAVTAAVKEFTGGAGADVILDMVGGDLFDESRRYVAFAGRVVVVGFMSGRIAELRTNHLILRNYTVMGVNAATYLERYPELHRAARLAVVDHLGSQEISPVIHAEIPLELALDAFGALAAGDVLGKAVITVN